MTDADTTAAAFALGFYFGVMVTETTDFAEMCPRDDCGYDAESGTCDCEDCPVDG